MNHLLFLPRESQKQSNDRRAVASNYRNSIHRYCLFLDLATMLDCSGVERGSRQKFRWIGNSGELADISEDGSLVCPHDPPGESSADRKLHLCHLAMLR